MLAPDSKKLLLGVFLTNSIMRYNDPKLTLVFAGNSPQTIVIGDDQIVRDSIVFEYQLMSKELKSSSDRVKITLVPNCVVGNVNVTNKIIGWQNDIQATLEVKENDVYVTKFSGYLNAKFNWKVNNHGEQCLALTIEDNNYLLDKVYSDTENYVNKVALTSVTTGYTGLIRDICNVCGITIANAQSLNKNITAVIKADAKCKDILSEVCYELGHVYRFNESGQLVLYKIAVENQTSTKTFNGSNLVSVKNSAVDLNKTLRQYNKAVVEFKKYASRQDSKIYQDISGQDSEHPNCNITIQAGYAYPSGLTIINPDTGTTRSDAELVGYVDCSDLSQGKELVTISSSVTAYVNPPATSTFTYTIAKSGNGWSAGNKKVGVLLKNTGNSPVVVTQLEATADIVYEDSDNKVIAGSASDSKVIDEELNYVHTDTEAKEFANLLAQYYKNSNLEYTFYSNEVVNIGSIVTLNENVYGEIVNQKLLIRAINDDGDKNYRKYTGVSISPFNLSEQTTDSGSKTSPTVIPGPKGEDGEPGDARVFNLIVQSKTYKRNMRDSVGNQTISVSTSYEGYTNPEVNIYCNITGIYANGVLTIPLKNTYDTITIRAVLTADELEGTLEKIETLNVDDITPPAMFIGCVTSMPTTTIEGDIINGDYFCVKTTFTSSSSTYNRGDCYRKIEGGWELMNISNSQASELLNCLSGFKQAGVSLKDISDHQGISWFNQIVADQMVVDSLKGNSALFKDIQITGSSTFYGDIDGDNLKTINSTTSSTHYISSSSGYSGSYDYTDVSNYIANSVRPTSGTTYSAGSGATINGKTISSMVYYSSMPSGVNSVASGNMPNNGNNPSIVNLSVTSSYPQVYRVYGGNQYDNPDYVIKIRILNNGSVEWEGDVPNNSASSTYVTTAVVQPGRTLQLYARYGYGESFNVSKADADNLGTGVNIFTSDGFQYCLGQNITHCPNTAVLLYGKSSISLNIKTTSSTWVVCNSSNWTPGVSKYLTYPGKTSGDAPTNSSSNISVNSATATLTNGTSYNWSNATSAQWGTDYISFYSNGSPIGGISSTDSLSSWNIDFWVSATTAGLSTKGIIPMDSNCSLGTSGNKWANGWFNNLNTGSLSITSSTGSISAANITATTKFLGQLGTSSNRSDAYIDDLYVNNISGGDLFYPINDLETYANDEITTNGQTITSVPIDTSTIWIKFIKIAPNITSFNLKAGYDTSGGRVRYIYIQTDNYCNQVSGANVGTIIKQGVIAQGSTIAVSSHGSTGGASGIFICKRYSWSS